MFLLIYKCRIAVSVRGKWFWKAWHCKLSLSDRLSVPADQKMPQSMMSDRQANSPGGQTLLLHIQTLERRESRGFGKGSWARRREAEAEAELTFRACARRSIASVMLMADEVSANLPRLAGGGASLKWRRRARESRECSRTMCLRLNLQRAVSPCPFYHSKENKPHPLAFFIRRLTGWFELLMSGMCGVKFWWAQQFGFGLRRIFLKQICKLACKVSNYRSS